jgi:hypothetical protein
MSTTTDPGCGKTYRLHGNRTGHCTRCHLTFSGSSAFDGHQRPIAGATTAPYSECLDPAEIASNAGIQTYERRSEPDSTDGFVWALVISDARKAQLAGLKDAS